MAEIRMNIKRLAEVLDLNETTIRVYCSGWVMSKYFSGKSLLICVDSINRLYTFLKNRMNLRSANLWKKAFPKATYIEDIEEKI